MNISEHFDHPAKKKDKEFFVHLVRIAKADDTVSSEELMLLHSIGRKLGFTDPEIDNLVTSTTKTDYIPPYELSKRFEQVYDIVKMTLADGVIDNHEMRLANSFAVKSGFSESEITALLVILISGIKQGKDEEELFEEYKEKLKKGRL
jgi:hypothetical protein